MKRTITIVGIILAVVVVVLAAYYFSRGSVVGPDAVDETPAARVPAKLPPAPNFSGGKGGGGIPGGEEGGEPSAARFGVVAPNPVTAYYVDEQNNVFIVQPDGKIYRITGSIQSALSEKVIENIIQASFSADGAKAFVVFGDPEAPQTSVFDIVTKAWQPLSLDVKAPAWSPDDERIVFLSSNSKEFSVVATLDLKNPKAKAQPIVQLYAQDVVLDWTGKDEVVVMEKSSSYANSSAWRLNLTTKTMTPIFEDLRGALVAWNSAAQRGPLFMASRANRGGDLSIIDSSKRLTSRIQVVTLPTKCTFTKEETMPSSTTSSTSAISSPATTTKTTAQKTKAAAPQPIINHFMVCGFPKNTREFNLEAQPDAYFQYQFYSDDHLYKIDLESGVVTNLFPENTYVLDANKLRIINKKLFFVNRYDSKLYALAL